MMCLPAGVILKIFTRPERIVKKKSGGSPSAKMCSPFGTFLRRDTAPRRSRSSVPPRRKHRRFTARRPEQHRPDEAIDRPREPAEVAFNLTPQGARACGDRRIRIAKIPFHGPQCRPVSLEKLRRFGLEASPHARIAVQTVPLPP